MSDGKGSTGVDTIAAYLETQPDGQTVAYALDLAGCFAIGATPQEALAHLAAALPAYYEWLRAHDEYMPLVNAGAHPVVAESQAVAVANPDAAVATFSADRAPLSDEDLDWYFALLGWALEDLTMRPTAAGIPTQLAQRIDRVLAALQLVGPTAFADEPHSALDGHGALLRALPFDQRARETTLDGITWTPRKALRWGITCARANTDS